MLDNKNDILGYSRTLEGKTFYTVINNKNKDTELHLDLSKYSTQDKELTDLLTYKKVSGADNRYTLKLQRYGVVILQ